MPSLIPLLRPLPWMVMPKMVMMLKNIITNACGTREARAR